MKNPPESECRSCGAPIIWVEMESGKHMPLDVTPVKEGTVIIRHGPRQGQTTGHVETKKEREHRMNATMFGSQVAFLSHFATCPEAGEWRRNKGK